MNTNFVRIGNRIINLALVTVVNLDAKNYVDAPVIAVGFDKNTEVWFVGDDYETAKVLFENLVEKVDPRVPGQSWEEYEEERIAA